MPRGCGGARLCCSVALPASPLLECGRGEGGQQITKPLGWGLPSAAKIVRECVAPAIHAAARCRITAIASRTPGKAEALAVALLCTPAAAGDRARTSRMVALLLNGLRAGPAP